VFTKSIKRECSPEVKDATLATAALLDRMGHRVEHLGSPPVPQSFIEDFLLYWALLSIRIGAPEARRPSGNPSIAPG